MSASTLYKDQSGSWGIGAVPEHLASRATAAESDFRKLVDIAPAMIWVADLDGSCSYLSRSWTTFTGQEMEDGIGQGWLSLIHSDDRHEVLGALALDAAQLAVWELDILNDRIAPSPMLNVLYGFPPDAQPSLDDLRSRYAPGEKERLEQLGREAAERGEDRIRAEVKHIMPDGSIKWLLVQAQTAAPNADGGPRAIGVVMDITDRKLHEEKLAVAAREMQHRIKNSLALVQSMVGQSFRADRSVEEGKEAFSSRLQAYAGVTSLLSGERKGQASLPALLDQALSPFREAFSEQFVIDAPEIVLPERIAFGVALAINELATNAIKYGALSVAEGVVHIECRVASNELYLTWRESGGPSVEEPRSRGFGTKLLQGAVLQGGEGSATLSFLPDGVYFEAKLPLNDV
ncbi:HWE histidine kinase domain-containing protein [Devosia sediminis]|uniref:Blue-light-activated histidine kinase n=1 Tax=Devosia sediminis TaxID=2798801 RepID=A0A934ITG6_9HYPH|nr:HWE histidine kinase domain-containing protein [Devosia sediminis]MBJ3784027.1 PAS domain S-box protein [Devosia sediminis]